MPHLASAEDATAAWKDFVVNTAWKLKPDFKGRAVAGDRKYTTREAIWIDDLHKALLNQFLKEVATALGLSGVLCAEGSEEPPLVTRKEGEEAKPWCFKAPEDVALPHFTKVKDSEGKETEEEVVGTDKEDKEVDEKTAISNNLMRVPAFKKTALLTGLDMGGVKGVYFGEVDPVDDSLGPDGRGVFLAQKVAEADLAEWEIFYGWFKRGKREGWGRHLHRPGSQEDDDGKMYVDDAPARVEEPPAEGDGAQNAAGEEEQKAGEAAGDAGQREQPEGGAGDADNKPAGDGGEAKPEEEGQAD